MLKNRDILLFQFLNWIGNYSLYISFLKFTSSDIFSKIAAGEILFAAIGNFIFIRSVRSIEALPALSTEIANLFIRVILGIFIYFLVIIFSIDIVYFYASLSVLLIPSHLPIKLGFNSVAYIFISFKLLLSFFVFLNVIILPKTSNAALIYFLPNYLYGIGMYFYYLKNFNNLRHKIEKKVIDKHSSDIVHISLTFFFSFVSAQVVARVVEFGFYLAALERLTRSIYSFTFPYLIRLNIHHSKNVDKIVAGYLYIMVLMYLLTIHRFVLIFVPVGIDMYISMCINRNKTIDILVSLIVLVLYFIIGVFEI